MVNIFISNWLSLPVFVRVCDCFSAYLTFAYRTLHEIFIMYATQYGVYTLWTIHVLRYAVYKNIVFVEYRCIQI